MPCLAVNASRLAPFFVIALLLGCANKPSRDAQQFQLNPQDYGMIAGASLKLIEHLRPIDTIVVDTNVSPIAREGLRELRKVIRRDSLNGATNQSLPRGYLVMRRFDIEDGEAVFEGEISTDVNNELTAQSDCGLIFAVRFDLNGGDWHSDSYKLTDCSQQRVWFEDEAHRPVQQ